jgi:hypothetical protein
MMRVWVQRIARFFSEKCAVVGVRGFEPRISASQAQRVTGLRYTPTNSPTGGLQVRISTLLLASQRFCVSPSALRPRPDRFQGTTAHFHPSRAPILAANPKEIVCP